MKLQIKQIPPSKNSFYFLVTFSIYFAFQFVTAVIANYFNPELTESGFQSSSLLEELVAVVIVAPVLETIIFQFIIIEALLKLKLETLPCIIISALLFGVSHWYNLAYVGVATVVGFVFAYYYLALRHQRNYNKLTLVILLHALSNLFVFIEKNFTEILKQFS